jgi:tetratricopeptide (TPR) repeat protein
MRRSLLVLTAVTGQLSILALGTAGPAAADDAVDRALELARRGTALGQQGRETNDPSKITEAIALFREAIALDPDWQYQCSLAIAYKDLERYNLAHFHFGRCIARMGGASPERKEQLLAVHAALDQLLRERGFVPVDIVSEPRAAVIELAPPFEAGEKYPAPFQLWLEPGDYVLRATMAGYRDRVQPIAVSGPGVETAKIRLEPAVEPPAPDPVGAAARPPPVDRPAPSRTLPIVLVVTGAAAIAGGGAFHARFAAGRDDAEAAPTIEEYDRRAAALRRERIAAIGLYSAGAVLAGYGLYRLLRNERAAVTVAPAPAGPVVSLHGVF